MGNGWESDDGIGGCRCRMDGGENVCAMVNRLESTMGVERR